MTIEKLVSQIDTLALSYREMTEFGFNPEFTQDYLEQIRNLLAVVIKSNESIDQINQNTDDIEINTTSIAQNSLDIAQNASDISDNTANISTNTSNISANTSAISQVASDLSDHEAETTAHGVTGNNVGTGDYAESLTGGVVLLADLIVDLTQIATPDIGAAPATYNQAYTQSVTDLTNENKAKINEIVLKINALIAGQITAKQMSAV